MAESIPFMNQMESGMGKERIELRHFLSMGENARVRARASVWPLSRSVSTGLHDRSRNKQCVKC